MPILRIPRIPKAQPPQPFVGLDNWAPDGFVDPMDEYAQSMALINPYLAAQLWSRNAAFKDKGDESFGGSSYAYIPTEAQVGAAIAVANFTVAAQGPVQSQDPQMNQLIQSLYQQANQFWIQLRNSRGNGW